MASNGTTMKDIDLNSADRFLQGYPHEWWTLLRKEDPVHWQEGTEAFPGYWCITKYEDAFRVSRDPMTFISSKGINADANPEVTGEMMGAGKMLIVTDPPRHVKLRRLVNKGFTPRQISKMEGHVREIVTRVLDDVLPRGEADFVTEIAAKLPVAVICEMMGVPLSDGDLMFRLSNQIIGSDDPEYQLEGQDRHGTAQEGQMEMFGYFHGLLQERLADPKEDLTTIIAQSEVDGEKLTVEEILLFCFLLILAGNETTRNATSGGMLAFLEHPEQRQRVIAGPSLMPGAVEEVLRWTSPVMHFARFVTKDTEIRGQKIREGEKIVMWYPSINHDEDIFDEPFTFDVGRSPNDHLAFGTGEHFCLGAQLARLELLVTYEELMKRAPRMELAGEPARLRSNFIGGIKHLPVKFNL